jgi:hypothetical protein
VVVQRQDLHGHAAFDGGLRIRRSHFLRYVESGGPTTSGGGAFITGLEAFYMLTPDLKPINGVSIFFQQLIISTEGGRLFKLSGTTAATYKWDEYYAGSSATGTESLANTGNDVIYMKQGGGVDLLSTTIESGDVSYRRYLEVHPDYGKRLDRVDHDLRSEEPESIVLRC